MKNILTYLLFVFCIFAVACTKQHSPAEDIPIPEGVYVEEPGNMQTISINKNKVVFDGVVTESEYGTTMPLNLSYGSTHMGLAVTIAGESLFLGVLCDDAGIVTNLPGMNDKWAPSDGLNVYVDGGGASYNAITSHVRKIITIPDGGYTLRFGRNDGLWSHVYESHGIESKGFILEGKYMFEMRIPYAAIGVKDVSRATFAFELRETSGGEVNYVTLPGVDSDRPFTWCPLKI